MPTLYLHCGLHKTGTTSLQKAFYDNRAWLAAQGVLYPDTGLSTAAHSWGHHEAAYALRHLLSGRRMWEDLRAEAEASGAGRVVISSEEFSNLPFPSLPALRPFRLIAACFEGWDIRLVCYLRPQADMLASLYVHQVKATGETCDIFDFMIRAAPKLDYAARITPAAQIFGQDKIVIRRYQPGRLTGGDTFADFAHLIGLETDPARGAAPGFVRHKAPLNPGLTARGLAKMLEANRRFANDPARLQTRRQKIIAAHPATRFEGADPLTPDLRRAIAALYTLRNRHLARHYLNEAGELFDAPQGPSE